MTHDRPSASLDRVQGLWIGPRLSPLERCSIRSFLANGHGYDLYTYDPVEGVPDGVTLRPAEEIVPRDGIFRYSEGGGYSGFANLFRYTLLNARGGMWVDLDLICLRPIDMAAPFVLAGQRNHRRWRVRANPCFLKAPAGHEFLRAALDECRQKDLPNIKFGQIGPFLVSRLANRLDLRRAIAPPTAFCPIDWWRWRDTIEVSPVARLRTWLRLTRRSYAIHMWHEEWRRAGVTTSDAFDPRSLYERLKRRYA